MNLLFFNKNKKNKKALSPIISAVLMLIVAVILVIIMLSWGKDFTNKGTATTTKIYKENPSDFVVAKSTGIPQNNNTILVKNIAPPKSQATNSENQENPEYVKYKILDPKTRFHMINNDEFKIDPPLTLPPGQEIPFNLFCTPSSKFTVQLISKDNTYSDITYQNPNYNPLSCAIRQVSAGDSHTCAVLNDGTIKCWGSNDSGQLGNEGGGEESLIPIEVTGISNAVFVSSGGAHTCALLDTGKIKCWGSNTFGQLGDGSQWRSETPVVVNGIDNAVSVSSGGSHTCAVLADGAIKCWGCNGSGQLGDGTGGSNWYDFSAIPVVVSDIDNAVSVSSGGSHTCAVLADGAIKCWGDNWFGKLGNGSGGGHGDKSLVPVVVSDIDNAVSVSSGDYHTCAVLGNGKVKCWGANWIGQLGDGTSGGSKSTPVDVFGISDVISVSSGEYHTCAVLTGGGIQCWGNNYLGQLGDGTTSGKFTPVDVSGITNAVSVSSGGSHTCAVLADGVVQCWGDNYLGQLGDGTSGGSKSTPVDVFGISDVISVSAGYYYTCVVLEDGTIKCWGDNIFGQLGDGTTSGKFTPVDVSGITNAVSVSSGGSHTCAVLADGVVQCWGDNYLGQLGDGTSGGSKSTPADVSGITNAVSVSAGYYYTCAVLEDGTIKCWGDNRSGQLGNGSGGEYGDKSLVPVDVNGVSNAVSVSAGGKYYSHTCAVLADGSIKCWGDNKYGQLGNGSGGRYDDKSLVPVDVNGVSNAVSVSSGDGHTCAVLADGSIKCWGDNKYGQLGNGSGGRYDDKSLVPVDVNGVSNAVSVSSGDGHTCAVLADGAIKCWGKNWYGQLGDGTEENRLTPIDVFNLSNAVSVSSGNKHTCALLNDGTIKCWGSNDYGQLGLGLNFTTVDDSLYD